MEIHWKKIINFSWFKRLYVLYIFGFVVNFRPASPFFYEFLTSSKNFSVNVTTQEIFPVWFYSTAVQTLPVFLLVDFLKYNPVIIVTSLAGIVATCLFIWTENLTEIQVAQAFSGTVSAAEVAYYASIYAHTDKKNYQELTSYLRAAPLLGKTISNLLAQLLTYYDYLSYTQLYYFDFAALILAAVISIFLPLELQKTDEKSEEAPRNFGAVFSNFTQSYSNKFVVKWTVWSILTICCYNQVTLYVQTLWDINDIPGYNGVIEGVYGFLGLIATILGGFATFNWKFNGDLILSMTSLVQSFMMFFMSQFTNYNVVNAVFYVIFGFMFHFITTILSAELAKFLNKGCFGLVFGFIALGGNALSSLMVCLLNDDVGFKLEIHNVFMTYGFYYLLESVLFIVIGLIYWFAKHTFEIE